MSEICLALLGFICHFIENLLSGSTDPLLSFKSRTCPYEARTLYALPKYLLIVFAFAGDSTITTAI